MVSDVGSSVPRYNVSACVLKTADSVIIRVILTPETVLELAVSFKGGIPAVCIDYRRFQLDKTFPQSPADRRD